MTVIWQRERRQELFRYAAAQVKDHFAEDSWQAFWMTAVEGASGEEVANRLGKSVGAVYAARSRVLARMRKAVALIEEVESQP